jgi:nicotinate-nucleotide--dimethylbenzimidazole phosphoribosyltransferase
MTASALPFDDIRNLLAALPPSDEDAATRARSVFARAAARQGPLGKLADVATWLAAWSGRFPPLVARPLVAVFAGTHGVAPPSPATADAVEFIASGGAVVSQACVAADLGLKVFDLALHLPVGDITREAALDERGCAATMAFGMEAVAGDVDLLCLAGMGDGGAVAAAALFAALFGGEAAEWTASGEGDDAAARKQAVGAALALHGSHLSDPLEALRRLGGREFAALAGAIVAARVQKVPVLLDGATALATGAVLKAINPHALDHCLLAMRPADPATAKAAARLGFEPLLDLGIAEGQGAGGALAAELVKTAAAVASGSALVFGRN